MKKKMEYQRVFYNLLLEEHVNNFRLSKLKKKVCEHIENRYRLTRESSICPICHETISFPSSHVTPCNHVYHMDCIRRWSKTKDECPICRGHLCDCDECAYLKLCENFIEFFTFTAETMANKNFDRNDKAMFYRKMTEIAYKTFK